MRIRPKGVRLHRADSTQIRVPARRIVDEALAGLFQRPSRSILTAFGTFLGIGAFVSVLGLTSTANGQVTQQFNKLAATQVTVTTAQEGASREQFGADAVQRVRRLNGVIDAGVMWNVDGVTVSKFAPGSNQAASIDEAQAPVVAVSPSLWSLMRPKLVSGRAFDNFTGRYPVAVVGDDLARSLGITDVASRPVIFISGRPFTVIGTVRNTVRVESPGTSIAIPTQAAIAHFGQPQSSAEMTIETALGAAAQVASEAPLALSATNPDRYIARAPVDPTDLQDKVSAELRSLFLALAGVCLLVGMAGIANANLLAVMERVPEIGLRRSLGAQPRHIGGQFLIESSVLGAFGGVVGSCVGVISVIVVALARNWTAVIEPTTVLVAPLLGAVVGLLAGLYPALRAARIDPVEAFRR